MTWLENYYELAARTDSLSGHPGHHRLLAAGLAGEVGSVCAEIKKAARDEGTYPGLRQRLTEELGDTLWYFCRLVSILGPDFFNATLSTSSLAPSLSSKIDPLSLSLRLASCASSIVEIVDTQDLNGEANSPRHDKLRDVWCALNDLATSFDIKMSEVADFNRLKTLGRWPVTRTYHPLFDEDFPTVERIPRQLQIEFLTLEHGTRQVVLLRCNGLNFGDRLTDNIRDPDGYRYHDIFHFAHAVFLGWSPVIRSLLRIKRKSCPIVDEAEDGARASIIEEAISALVFSRAKTANFFASITQLDYDLLKVIKELTAGYEVETVPEWQWEKAILEGYRVFRALRENRSGSVSLDLNKRELVYAPLENNSR